MQVSCDEAVKYISKNRGRARDSERDWYRVNCTDNEGNIITVYAEPDAYDRCGKLDVGDPVGLVLQLRPSSKGISVTLTDVIIGTK